MQEVVLLIPVSVLLASSLNRLNYFILRPFFEKQKSFKTWKHDFIHDA